MFNTQGERVKILFFELEPQHEQLMRSSFPTDELFFFKQPLTIDAIPSQARDADIISIFICSCITAQVIDSLPNLKLIVTRSTGCDHICLEVANKKNIVVCNAPTYADISVAEYTFALLLSLSRHINSAWFRTAHESSFSLDNLRGFDLHGKTIGVIGTGNIGSKIISIARCFGMKPIAYDLYSNNQLAQELGFTYVPFEQLLQQSDVVTLHVPLNNSTHHLINKKNISQIKKGAYLINPARGGIVETEALLFGLQKNIIAGAALDVLEEECFIQDPLLLLKEAHPQEEQLKILLENHELIKHPRVIITPHNAFNSEQAIERLLKTTINSIASFKNGTYINQVRVTKKLNK